MHSSRMRTVSCSSSLRVCVGGVCPGGSARGGVSAWGVSLSAWVSVCPGGCLTREVSAWGVSARGYLPRGGVCPLPLPVNRITDACEKITLPQLRCGR